MAEMMPSPPPFDTAAASFPSAIQAMPPWKMGYSIPSMSQIGVCINLHPLHFYAKYGDKRGCFTGKRCKICSQEANVRNVPLVAAWYCGKWD